MIGQSGLTADANSSHEVLIEDLWRDLGGRVTRDRIRQLVNEAATEFQNATITTFVPVFIRRRIREKLSRND